MTQAPGNTITLKHTFAAPRDRVFRAWTDAEAIKEWFGRPEGASVPAAKVDLQPGGRYRIELRGPGPLNGNIVGTFREVEPPARLVSTFEWEDPDGSWSDTAWGLVGSGPTLVTVEFHERGDETDVVLTHERLDSEMSRSFNEFGWAIGFERLDELLARAGGEG